MLFMSRYDQKEVVFILIMLLLLLCVIKHILFKIMNKENISLVKYSLGQENLNNVEMKIHSIKLEKNDLLLIMSKGIYEEIRWVDFENILNKNKKHIDIALNEIIDEIEHHENTHNGSIIIMKNNM
ncbi:hypothetical protein EXM65_09980 [Clostridium botulinum]|uniref:PPM-type phosphatase domain-containing protein n=1 Tax=Clostridium botulinum TaxID=1491 RepID=A0A6M0SNM0_CLOBO|nr:hypothetical protein [Clostridium botulinum]